MLRKRLKAFKQYALSLLYKLKAYELTWRLFPNKAVILMFHGFYDPAKTSAILDDSFLAIDKFRQLLIFLKQHYNIISLPELAEHLRSGKRLPPRSIVLTMDDGFRAVYTLAYPQLKKHKLPFTVFFTTNFIDSKEILWPIKLLNTMNQTKATTLTLPGTSTKLPLKTSLDRQRSYNKCTSFIKSSPVELKSAHLAKILSSLWYPTLQDELPIPEHFQGMTSIELKELSRDPLVTIGNHTATHPRCTQISGEELKNELNSANQQLKALTGSDCRFFAYPHGAPSDFNAATGQIVKDLGFHLACTTVDGVVRPDSDPFSLKRLAIDDSDSILDLIFKLTQVK